MVPGPTTENDMNTKDLDAPRPAPDHRDEWAVAELSRKLESREDELASIRAQRDDAAAAMLAVLRPELERMVETIVVHGGTVENIRLRLEDLEVETRDLSLTIRQEVREMIADGDITVSVDVM
jgi:hypothetical protein